MNGLEGEKPYEGGLALHLAESLKVGITWRQRHLLLVMVVGGLSSLAQHESLL